MKDPKKQPIDDIDYLDQDQIASSTECTGLIPALPADDDELKSYREIYSIPKQEDPKNNKQK